MPVRLVRDRVGRVAFAESVAVAFEEMLAERVGSVAFAERVAVPFSPVATGRVALAERVALVRVEEAMVEFWVDEARVEVAVIVVELSEAVEL